MNILFLTRSLESGGAERQLISLAIGMSRRGHSITIAQLYTGGLLEQELVGENVKLVDLKKKGRWNNVSVLLNLKRAITSGNPDVTVGILGVQNIFLVLIRPFFPSMHCVWTIAASNMDLSRYDWLARLSYRFECLISRFVDLIISNSYSGSDYAVLNGFPSEKIIVIPNGVDTHRFVLDRNAGLPLRRVWGIPPTVPLVGIVGRLDPMKDHETFLRAAAIVLRKCPVCRFVCIGRGTEFELQGLQGLCRDLDVEHAVIWAGERSDLPSVYNALDLHCLSSISEGLPNVLIEAMACGLPCVTTDVGDTKKVLGSTGSVVPIKDPEKLGKAMLEMLQRSPQHTNTEIRERIVRHYSLDNLVTSTEDALFNVLEIQK